MITITSDQFWFFRPKIESNIMGANFSNLEFIDKSPKPLFILTFHSTAKWKLHFDATKETNKLMDFTATWCGSCKYMDPIIRDFAAKYTDVEFIKLDVDELMVQVLPTFILIKKGKVVEKVVGAKKEVLQKLIEKCRN
ncbi:hypothetical protein Lal_00031166 [Lupinus albus]|uniref:Putative monodehydroascorbate reductase (NADH) n=1 Tax=Lupinus albus TaxID=3870 RepID=A0A6A5LW05_LUPAL|nr:putative monodehydroascorbate reductase (NADH) [Lupinus albus]KAF1864013.1 hypothetical protein Lal_00031166 [Lupinus albus]